MDRGAFRPSYRPERPAGLDPDMKRMGVLAAGIGGVMALLVGGAWLVRPAHHGVPVVDADPGPVRVKPANPGGMQVTGADFGGPSASGPHLAPAAEAPELNALQQKVREMQRQLARQAAANAAARKLAEQARLAQAEAARARLAAAQPRPAATVTKLAAAAPRIAPPAPVQHASATAIVPATPSPPANFPEPFVASSGITVQLAALTDAAAANTEWTMLMQKAPELFGGRQPDISHAQAAGRSIWRLRTGGFSSVSDAANFCAKVRAKGADCSIAAF
jgi:hypothetical protein